MDNFPIDPDPESPNVLVFPFFPRREEAFGVETFIATANKIQRAGRVKLPSPVATRYPVWSPEPLPITRQSGSMGVTLTEVTTGWSWRQRQRAATGGEAPISRLKFRTETKAPNWTVVGVSLADAMGGGYEFAPHAWSRDSEGLYVQGGNLCREEPAYQFRLEFSRVRTQGARPDRQYLLATLDPRTMQPHRTQELPLSDGRRLTAFNIDLDSQLYLAADLPIKKGEVGQLWAEGAVGSHPWRGIASTAGRIGTRQHFELQLPKGLRKPRLYLGLFHSRFVTFTVKPKWVGE